MKEYTYACIDSSVVWGFTVPVDRIQSVSLANGLVAPANRSNSYYNPTSVLQESYTYDIQSGSQTDGNSGYSVKTYPIATDTVYANADGTGAETTSYAYTWYATGTAAETITTTQPVVSTAQNGSGVAATTVAWYDADGNLVWSQDARGYLTYNEYDPVTGLLMETIQNVNSSTTLPTRRHPAFRLELPDRQRRQPPRPTIPLTPSRPLPRLSGRSIRRTVPSPSGERQVRAWWPSAPQPGPTTTTPTT